MERGIGTSRGIGIGHVLVVCNQNAVVNRETHYNTDEEKTRFFEARKTFIEQTESLLSDLEKKLGESDKDALVLKNQIYLAKDITTENEVVSAIDSNCICAEAAFEDVCNKLVQLFSSLDNPDMQQRVTDIQDMKERMIQILQGTKAFDLTNLPDNTVLLLYLESYYFLYPSADKMLSFASSIVIASVLTSKPACFKSFIK